MKMHDDEQLPLCVWSTLVLLPIKWISGENFAEQIQINLPLLRIFCFGDPGHFSLPGPHLFIYPLEKFLDQRSRFSFYRHLDTQNNQILASDD